MEFHPIRWGKKGTGQIVCVCGHELQSEACIATAEEIIEWVGKNCYPEITLSVKKWIGFALTEPEEPTLGEKEKVIAQMTTKKLWDG